MTLDGPSGRPILVFDSGIGGLSVYAEIRRRLPHHRIDYLADDGGFPYGDRAADDVARRVVGLIGAAIERLDPLLVVIACNTASTVVLPLLRARYPLPFVGTVPAVKPAAERSRSGHITVLATPATIARDYTRGLVRQFAGHCRVRLVGAPDLAALAEAALRGEAVEDEAIGRQIAPCFVVDGADRTDIVVLACTHFPLLAERLERLAPWSVTWLDPAPAIARRVCHLVAAGTSDAPARRPRDAAAGTAFFSGSDRIAPALAPTFAAFGLTLARTRLTAFEAELPDSD